MLASLDLRRYTTIPPPPLVLYIFYRIIKNLRDLTDVSKIILVESGQISELGLKS